MPKVHERLFQNSQILNTCTLDVKDYIADFLYNNKVDGILSNYPSLVAGMQYTRR